ncbi:MAG: ATP-dependent helicase [Acidimicrobiaceae bacterium]|nr:ATP-dependent helicase [Acidimicrobiaceae bacterium]
MNLSDEQRTIVNWDEPSQVLLAVSKAGTGKTTTAAELIRTQVASGRRVLALTFTRNGTGELASQLERTHSITFEAKNGSLLTGRGVALTLATFDSFLRRELKQLSVSGASWKTAKSIWVCEHLHARAGSVLCMEYPELFTRKNLTQKLEQLCSDMDLGNALVAPLRETFEPIWMDLAAEAARLERLLPGGYAQLVLEHSHDISRRCLSDYDYLIVDESQDTSRHELNVLAKLATKMRVVCLGDPGQNLMGFRGALGDLEREFRVLGVPCRSTTLSVNRRSLVKLVAGQNSLQRLNGWHGKYATAARLPEGVEPLFVVGRSEGQLLEALLYMLNTFTGQGKSPQLETRTGGLNELVCDRASLLTQVGALTNQRLRSIVLLVPTNQVGRSLESALLTRGVVVPFLQADFNPFDTREARLLLSWCDPEGEFLWTRIQLVLEAHFKRPRKFSSERAKTEMQEIFNKLVNACSHVSGDPRYRLPLSDALKGLTRWVDLLQGKSHVFDEQTHDYLNELRDVCRLWSNVHAESSLESSLNALSSVTLNIGARQRRSSQLAVASTLEPWIFREARKDGISPAELSEWIRERSLSVESRPSDTMQVVYPCIKTIFRSKGDTVDVSILYRADKVPPRVRTSPLQSSPDAEKLAQDALGLEYVAASRARYVHIQLALGNVGSHHEYRLPGWVYHVAK